MKLRLFTLSLLCVAPMVFAADATSTNATAAASAATTTSANTTPEPANNATPAANASTTTAPAATNTITAPATTTPTTNTATTPAPSTTTPVAQENVPLLPGDADRGLAKSQTCVACHGTDGNSVIPNYPKIAGQHAGYIIESLHEYREGPGSERDNPIMYGFAITLSDQDILDLAAYYASQKVTIGETDPALVTLGEKIYRGGNVEANVPACIACHGPRGEGNYAANFPSLSGQNAAYVVDQLHAFRSGTRKGGVNDMMAHVVERISEDEVQAVASYISGLH